MHFDIIKYYIFRYLSSITQIFKEDLTCLHDICLCTIAHTAFLLFSLFCVFIHKASLCNLNCSCYCFWSCFSNIPVDSPQCPRSALHLVKIRATSEVKKECFTKHGSSIQVSDLSVMFEMLKVNTFINDFIFLNLYLPLYLFLPIAANFTCAFQLK